jgi:hypothetical protein
LVKNSYFEGYGLYRMRENPTKVVVLKGTGFSPYINAAKSGGFSH